MEIEKILKNKKLLFAMWGCEDKLRQPHANPNPLKKLFREVIIFDPRKKRDEHGTEKAKKMLLKIVKREKPDFLLFSISDVEIFGINMLKKINEISEKTITIAFMPDDDTRFENWSRWHVPFIDYVLVVQTQYLAAYKKDNINVFIAPIGIDTEYYKPLALEKKYDVVFIGSMNKSRVELMKFLIKNNINLRIWGNGWQEYSEFRDVYMGQASKEDYIKIINQSKINLGLTRNKYGELHIIGKIFEIAACKAFRLVDYFPEYFRFFKKDKEIVMFKDKEELVKKIKYYLEHEREREKIAENAYKKIISRYNTIDEYKKIFKTILKKKVSRKLPKINKRIITISKNDFENLDEIRKKANRADYISFISDNAIYSEYKNYLQIYSLEKTKKEISCCDYYVYSKNIGNYLLFQAYDSFKVLERKDFNRLLNINQMVVRKDYFLKNIEKFVDFLSGKSVDIINEKNTVFISLPLVQIEKINKIRYEEMCKAFQFTFATELYSLMNQKRLLFNKYLYQLVIESVLKGNLFILKYLIKSAFKKKIKNLLKK